MSTIKSSAENLTLNADGANNDIKFQSNGSEVASIDQAGVMTATSFAGSGANLTGLSSFNPDAAVTINESGADVDFRVESDTKTHALFVDGALGRTGINKAAPEARLDIVAAGETGLRVVAATSGEYAGIFQSANTNSTPILDLRDSGGNSKFKALADGRGVSQFTAHAWGKINGTGTPGLLTGHNVSSITDQSTGRYRCNYTTNSGGANTVVISGQNNSYYDEIYYLDVDESNSAKAAFGCSRSGTGAGWFDTYKMSFVTFALTS